MLHRDPSPLRWRTSHPIGIGKTVKISNTSNTTDGKENEGEINRIPPVVHTPRCTLMGANLLLDHAVCFWILQSPPEGDAIDAKQCARLHAGRRRQPLLRQEIAQKLERWTDGGSVLPLCGGDVVMCFRSGSSAPLRQVVDA